MQCMQIKKHFTSLCWRAAKPRAQLLSLLRPSSPSPFCANDDSDDDDSDDDDSDDNGVFIISRQELLIFLFIII